MVKFNLLYQSICEGIEDKLKEDVFKLFRKNNFKEKIIYSENQPSLIATKYTIENLDYDIIPCEGTFREYKYYFPVVTIKDNKFVVDIGNNLDGKIVPKVLLLDNSEYKITKEYTVNNFLKEYNNLQKEYNI